VLQLLPLKAAGERTCGAQHAEPQPLRLSAVLGPTQDDAQFSSMVLLPASALSLYHSIVPTCSTLAFLCQ
jgi:hypothetical protein